MNLEADGFDFLGFNVRRYNGKLLIKPSKAAVETDTEEVGRRDVRPARLERPGSSGQAIVPITRGVGGLSTGAWCRRGCSAPWTTTCGNSPTSGRNTATRTSRRIWIVNRYYGTFNTARHEPDGCSVTGTVAVTYPNSPGPELSGITWCQERHLRMTQPWPILGRSASHA